MVLTKEEGMYENSEHIVKLNYNDFIKKNNKVILKNKKKFQKYKGKIGLLKVYAEWCGHCKTFKPILNNFKNNNPDIEVVIYEDNKEKNQEYNVEGFPTLISEHSDGTRINFTGPRTEEGLLNFYNK